jgi:hypothetical protein
VVVDYVYRRGHFVVVLALAAEAWDRAHARGCDPSVVREGVSVSVYVYAYFVYGFVVDRSGVVGFFACGALIVCLRRWPFLALLSVYQLRPCAGRHLLSLPPRRKESKQRKRAATASP